MAVGKSGSFDLTTTKANVKVRINWSETYDIADNASPVRIDSVQVMALSPYGYYGYTYYPEGTIKIDGEAVVEFHSGTPTHSVRIAAQDTWYAVSGAPYESDPIAHNTDGSRSVTIAVNITGYSSDGSGDSGWKVSGSKTVELTAIPRASSIGATDANVEATSVIAVNRKSAAYTHSIAFEFGSLTGYIDEDGAIVSSETKITAANIAFKIPAAWYNQIPDAPSGICTLTCTTFSGTTQIGDPQATTFIVTASPALCRPEVSGASSDTDSSTLALTGNKDAIVRYMSDVLCEISAQAKNGASIVSKTINGISVSGNSLTFSDVESSRFVFSVTDSRGYSSSITYIKHLIEYIIPTATVSCSRIGPTSGEAELEVTGNFFSGSFGTQKNALTIRYRIGNSGDWTTVSDENLSYTDVGYSAKIPLSGLDYLKQYRIYVSVSDKLVSLDTKSTVLEKGIPVAHWGEHDFTVENVLLAVGGQSTVLPDYSDDLEDESGLNEWLEKQLEELPDDSVSGVAIAMPNAWGTNARFCCLLYKNSSGPRAAVFGFTYTADLVIKRKNGGSWLDAVIQQIGG